MSLLDLQQSFNSNQPPEDVKRVLRAFLRGAYLGHGIIVGARFYAVSNGTNLYVSMDPAQIVGATHVATRNTDGTIRLNNTAVSNPPRFTAKTQLLDWLLVVAAEKGYDYIELSDRNVTLGPHESRRPRPDSSTRDAGCNPSLSE